MLRDKAVAILKSEENVKVTHWLFDDREFIYCRDGKVYDENGYLFEDWISTGPNAHNGVRMRIGGNWDDGWDLYN